MRRARALAIATSSCYEHQQAVIFPFNRPVQAVVLLLPATHRPAELTIHLALHSAEEPGDLRATTGTVEVPTIRDNDAALALGTRPVQQHEPATADGPCHGLHNLHRAVHGRTFQFGQKSFDSIRFSLPNRFFRFGNLINICRLYTDIQIVS